MALDLDVARAVRAARLMERAVHDRGPWSLVVGALSLPAVRVIREDSIEFWATLPDACFLDEDPVLSLVCDGDVLAVKPFEPPARGGGKVRWIVCLAPLAVG